MSSSKPIYMNSSPAKANTLVLPKTFNISTTLVPPPPPPPATDPEAASIESSRLYIPHKASSRSAFKTSTINNASLKPRFSNGRGRQRMNCLNELDRPTPQSLELSAKDVHLLDGFAAPLG